MFDEERLTTYLSRARRMTAVLDNLVRLPGTRLSFGIEPVLSLIPGVGDAAGAALSGYLIVVAALCGVPASVIGRMIINVAVDALVGVVPVAGDVFDFVFKANTRNLALLERFVSSPHQIGRSSKMAVAVALGLLLCVFAAVGAFVWIGLKLLSRILGMPLW